MSVARPFVRIVWGIWFVAFCGGCSTLGSNGLLSAPGFLPSDEPLQEAQVQFGQGNYGLAEKHYREAVEKNPNSAESWLGLAASYDHLRRFDLADKAYDVVKKLVGETPSVLNNIGYSHLLRGDLEKARIVLLEAQNRDPENPFIQNNIDLLNERLREQ